VQKKEFLKKRTTVTAPTNSKRPTSKYRYYVDNFKPEGGQRNNSR